MMAEMGLLGRGKRVSGTDLIGRKDRKLTESRVRRYLSVVLIKA